jgi:hypothetical protein
MNKADEPAEGLPDSPAVPIESEDIDTLRDALHTAICAWEYPEGHMQEGVKEFDRLALMAEALAIAARATNVYQQPVLRAHQDDEKAATAWRDQRWRNRVHPEGTQPIAARLALETLGWRGVLGHLAADEDLAARFQELVTRFHALRGPGREPTDEGARRQGSSGDER